MRIGVWRWFTSIFAATAFAVAIAACGSANNTLGPPTSDTSDASAPTGIVINSSDGGGACVPKTCVQLAYTCGMNGDGCGGTLDCGGCPTGQICGGGGYSLCGTGGTGPDGGDGGQTIQCTPQTCQSLNIGCGYAGDGCGGVLTCGTCTGTQYCGGGGYNKCGGNSGLASDGGAVACQPTTCATLGYTCGVAADGCGGVLDCGSCANPQFCGGGGFNQCGGNNGLTDAGIQCQPTTCAALRYTCGVAADGCGGVLNCGSCTNPEYCGGGGYDTCGGNNGLTPDGGVACTPKSCATLGYTCGVTGDGCGGVLDCGTCTNPQYCGGGGFNQCGGDNGSTSDGAFSCTPATCTQLNYTCGATGDGCGGVLNCGTCTNPAYCGGGGFNQCGGNNGLTPDGGVACTPKTCAGLGYTCGVAGDGCGGVLSCGSCASPHYCGGGGFNQCGGNNGLSADGGVACTPKTCTQLNYTCGITGDGCGGSLSCGSCSNPQYCGGGGFNQCGGNDGLTPDGGVACTPTTCTKLGYNCGQAADGCGGLLNCGSCTDPQFCGGGGYDVCGGSNGLQADGGVACTPKTCAQLGYSCGAAGDGCGNLLNCGTCTAPQYCGGGGYDQCGPASISVCDGGATTSVSGFVYDPGNNLPVTNALVYVPIGAVQTPQTGVTPAACGCSAPPAYTSAYTGIDGSFTLNVASNASATLVVQLGKWQRAFTEAITPCTANTLPAHLTLPSTHLQGHIPLFAVDTGNVDTMECVLRKMGVADSEFVDPAIANGVPTAAGRVHFYQGSNFAGGAVIDNATPKEAALTETASVMDSYDVILFPCQGGQANYTAKRGFPNTLGNLLNFADDGGRVFATHYSYTFLYTNGTATTGFMGSAKWAVNGGSWGGPFTGNIDDQPSFPRGQALASWLHQPFVYGGTFDQIPVSVVRNDFTSATAPAQEWVYTTNPPDQGLAHMDIHYTFDTPFTAGGTAGTCGRVVFSDFHVEDASNNNAKGKKFPAECTAGPMTPQEKLLEFMLFDLTSCVSPPSCTPVTCAQQNISCGPAGDGCGNQLSCGSCTAPQTCGGGGTSGQCGYPDSGTCTPQTCQSQGIACGPAGDGCGNPLSCGSCTAPQTCGGGGVPGQCGYPEAGACQPLTCMQQGIACGPAGDGCGNQLGCGSCTAPQTCGGGGVPGQCGYPDAASCAPTSCATQRITCGPAGDGCGNLLDCGSCMAPATCGGGGVSGRCGSPDASSCAPLTCAQQNLACGPAGDGCGNLLNCGSCPSGQGCGSGGVPGQCGYPDAASCAPTSCAAQQITCGPAGDGCGHLLDCGSCVAPASCGGGGVAGQCGSPDAASCSPQSCAQQNIACGPAGDGCGNLLNCGSCVAPASCGGGGVSGQCGTPDAASCSPVTCTQQNVACGPAGDGCGNLIQCGSCPAGQTCGGGGVAGQCGAPDGGSCAPTSCAQQNIACGPAGDGCGNLIQCGNCPAGQTCGGGGVAGQCGTPPGSCVPLTCQSQGFNCGPAGDGCGNLIQCGACVAPLTCGGGGTPGVCGNHIVR